VLRHHTPAGNELAAVVALADRFAHDGTAPPELGAPLNIYPEDLEVIAKRADDIAATVKAVA
jgi:hypothetical protein